MAQGGWNMNESAGDRAGSKVWYGQSTLQTAALISRQANFLYGALKFVICSNSLQSSVLHLFRVNYMRDIRTVAEHLRKRTKKITVIYSNYRHCLFGSELNSNLSGDQLLITGIDEFLMRE